jgi:hypothetical protein
MVITPGAKVGCFLKSDFLFTVNPICLYGLVFTPTAAVNYHGEETISIKRKGQIPQWFAFIVPTLLSTVTTCHTLSSLKLNYFSHFFLSCSGKGTKRKDVRDWFSLHTRYQFESSMGLTSF